MSRAARFTVENGTYHVMTRGNNQNNILSATPLDTIPPAQVLNLIGSGYDKQVELKWDANQDTDIFAYNVYRSQTPGFTPDDSTKIAQVGHDVDARRQVIYF